VASGSRSSPASPREGREKTAAAAAAKEPARRGGRNRPESRVIIEYQDDNLTLFYLLEIVNNARTPIDIGGPMLIQAAARRRGRSMMQGSSQHASAKGDMLTITGPFAPGKTIAQVGFSLPQAGSEITIEQKWPARSRRCSSAWRRSAT
jgi:hypothetical protein